jgi:ArsR family transcriptional regulator
MINDIFEISDFFKALGDSTRIRLLKLLLSYNNLCVGMIAQKLKITQPAVSQHLKILKNNGIVEGKRIGFHVHYNIKDDVFKKFGIRLEKIIKITEGNSKLKDKCKSSIKSV